MAHSISVRGATRDKLKEKCDQIGKPVHLVVDHLINSFLDKEEKKLKSKRKS